MAQKAKEKAEAEIAKAEATKESAKDVSNKLDALNMNTFITSRFRRQDASTTAINNPTPSNCDDLKSTMKDLTNAMDYRAPDYDPARAMDIVAILTSLDSSYLSPGCSSSDLSELNDAKNAAKDNADAVVTTQTTLISAKTDELNALVLLIQALNQQISATGGTTIDPGTIATQVPPTTTEGGTSTMTTESGTTASTIVSTGATEGEALTTTIGSGTAATQVPPSSTGGETSTTKLFPATAATTQASTVDTEEGEESSITGPTFKIGHIMNSTFSSVTVIVF